MFFFGFFEGVCFLRKAKAKENSIKIKTVIILDLVPRSSGVNFQNAIDLFHANRDSYYSSDSPFFSTCVNCYYNTHSNSLVINSGKQFTEWGQ